MEWAACLDAVYDVLTVLLHLTPAPTRAALKLRTSTLNNENMTTGVENTTTGVANSLLEDLQHELTECFTMGTSASLRQLRDLGVSGGRKIK
jgi:hypothetical protein